MAATGSLFSRHLGGQAEALKANTLHVTWDLTGMWAGEGALEDGFRPQA